MATKIAPIFSRQSTGVVVSAGKMDKAVKVRLATQEWNKQVRKFFPSSKTYLVSDPNRSLREGDVIRIASGWRASRNIRHVVSSIIAPFGPPVSERPPVLSEEERLAVREKERLEKDVRRAAKGVFVSQQRLKEAEAQGKEIPTLEWAMRHVREKERLEQEEAAKKGVGIKKNVQGVKKSDILREQRRLAREQANASTQKATAQAVKQ